MRHTKLSTLVTLAKVIEKHRKYWCYASQNTILNLLLLFHNTVIRRRMLNYHLADLRREGLIKTYGRTHRRADGTICLLSSATALTIKGSLLLYKMGSTWALRHMKSLKNKYLPREQPPAQDTGETPDTLGKKPTTYPDKNPFLDQECRQKMGLLPLTNLLKKPA